MKLQFKNAVDISDSDYAEPEYCMESDDQMTTGVWLDDGNATYTWYRDEEALLESIQSSYADDLARYRIKDIPIAEEDSGHYTESGLPVEALWLDTLESILKLSLRDLISELNSTGDTDWDNVCSGTY